MYQNEFFARYGSNKQVRDILDKNDYAASQEMHKNPTLDADTLLQVHLKGASHSAKFRSLEHPNFKHHGLLNLYDPEIQHHSLNNINLSSDNIKGIYNKTSNSGTKAKVYGHPNCPTEVHDKAFEPGVTSSQVAAAIENPNCPVHRLSDIKNIEHDSPSILSKILQHPKTPEHILVKHGIESDMPHERSDVIDNPGLPYKHASAAIKGSDSRVAARAIHHPELTRGDLDHYIAHVAKHSTHNIPGEIMSKHYPDGYRQRLNTVEPQTVITRAPGH
jgi:hypothetical protein